MRTITKLERQLRNLPLMDREALLFVLEDSVSRDRDQMVNARIAEDVERMETIMDKYRPDGDDPNWLSEEITRQILADFRPCETPPSPYNA